MRVAVLASGSGTNLQALMDAEDRGQLDPAEIALVLSNRSDSGAIARARRAGRSCVLVEHTKAATREDFEAQVLSELRAHRVEALVLAGFMRILGPGILRHFPMKVINTHPALCPAFPGLHAPRQAIDYGVKLSGCTIHFVDSGIDSGPVIFQEALSVKDDDSPESLQGRIQKLEHQLLPKAVRLLASGQLHIEARKVRILDHAVE